MKNLKTNNNQARRIKISFAVAATLLIVTAALATYFDPSWLSKVKNYLNSEISPITFFALFLFLPAIGFPDTVFLISIGLAYDRLTGFLMLAVACPCHLIMTYYVTNRFLKNWMMNIIGRKYAIKLEIPKNKRILVTFLYFLVPGMPYGLKNSLFAITNVPFSVYLWIGSLVNTAMSLPIMYVGEKAANDDWFLVVAIIAILFVVQLAFRPLKTRLSTYFTRKPAEED